MTTSSNQIKEVPYDEQAEKQVIGSILLGSNEALNQIIDTLNPEDFYDTKLEKVYDIILDLDDKGKKIDLVMVFSSIKRRKLEEYIPVDILNDCVNETATSAHIKEHAETVKDKKILRELIRTSNSLLTSSKSSEELIDEAEATIFSLARRTVKKAKPIGSFLKNNVEKISLIQKGDLEPGIMTGIDNLDKVLSGFHPGDLIILGARTSVGKSSLALSIAHNISPRQTVALFSLEMSKEELGNRLLSLHSGVPLMNLRTKTVKSTKEMEEMNIKIEKACEEMGDYNLIIDDSPSPTIQEIRRSCRRIASEYKNLGLIIVDYLQLVRSTNTGKTNDKISEISRGLKIIAKELNVPVLALSQLNRNIEHRDDPRPTLSDLRDSGAIEQDADVILFLNKFSDFGDKTNVNMEIIIAKHRNGPIGEVDVKFKQETTKFS